MAWYNRGIALHELKRYEDALASFDRAIALDPDGDAAIAGRTRSLKALGRTREALESANRAIAVRKDSPAHHSDRGLVLKALGQTGEARSAFEQALALDPDCLPALTNFAGLLIENEDLEAALPVLRRALSLRETDELKEPVPRLLVVASRPRSGRRDQRPAPPRNRGSVELSARVCHWRGRGPDLRSCLRSDRRPRRCGMAAASPGGRALWSAGHSGNCKEPFAARAPDISARPERLARAVLDDGPHGTARDGVGRPFGDGGNVSAPSRCSGILLRARTAVLRERVRLHRIAGRNHACSHARRRTRPRAIIR